MSTMEQQIKRLTDIEDIKQLKLRYAGYCDQNYNPEGIASCFTDDGIWDGGDFGSYTGRDNIKEFFAGANELVTFAMHYTTNPLIEVNGDEATGEWHLWQPMVMKENNQAIWYMAQYSEKYVRQEGQWLIKHLVLTAKSFTPHDTSFG